MAGMSAQMNNVVTHRKGENGIRTTTIATLLGNLLLLDKSVTNRTVKINFLEIVRKFKMRMTNVLTSTRVTSSNKLPALKVLQRVSSGFRPYGKRRCVTGWAVPTFRRDANTNNSSFYRHDYNWGKQRDTRQNVLACKLRYFNPLNTKRRLF